MGVFKHSPGCGCCEACPCVGNNEAGGSITMSVPAANDGTYCSDCADLASTTSPTLIWLDNDDKDGRPACHFSDLAYTDHDPFSCDSDLGLDVWFFEDDILIEMTAGGGASVVMSFLASDHSWGPIDHDCNDTITITLTSDVEYRSGAFLFCTWPSTSVWTINP